MKLYNNRHQAVYHGLIIQRSKIEIYDNCSAGIRDHVPFVHCQIGLKKNYTFKKKALVPQKNPSKAIVGLLLMRAIPEEVTTWH